MDCEESCMSNLSRLVGDMMLKVILVCQGPDSGGTISREYDVLEA